MNKEYNFISEIDVLILNELLEVRKDFIINTTSFCNQLGKQHKILKPHIDHLSELGLIKIEKDKVEKNIKINREQKNLFFCKQLVSLWENKYLK